jgi:hypothetical protein
MSTTELLLEVLDCAFDRQSWHGANLISSLRGVRARDAAGNLPGRKSIWQHLLHAAYWKHRVLNGIIGTTPFPRRGSNWPKLPDEISEKAFKADLEMLRQQHRKLRQAVASLRENELTAKQIWRIHGVAAHDVYHAGQIKLLRRLIGNRNKAN